MEELFQWYQREARSLPWRENPSPYPVFLSEIILQQTRVAQGLPYFHRFLEVFPSIQDLANASEEEVLKLWQGLGYYSRARNLHKAAKYLVENYEGLFPANLELLLKIPGIGPYTARAILAFAFHQPFVATDGNIWRVTSRYFGLKDEFPSPKSMQLSQEIWKNWVTIHPSNFNNALMDMGASICTPSQPLCEKCPLQITCFSFPKQAWKLYPTKTKKTKVKPLTLIYLIEKRGNQFLIKKRTEDSIWANLYDFPEITLDFHGKVEEEIDLIRLEIEKNCRIKKVLSIEKQPFHLLSHRKIQPFFCFVEFVPILQLEKEEIWVTKEELFQLPIPKIIETLIATF